MTPGAGRGPGALASLLLALLPGLVVSVLMAGAGVALNLLLAAAAALAVEALFQRPRQAAPASAWQSSLATGLLLGLAVPPGAAWWLAPLGAACAVGLGKHAFGGLGRNPLNPAMLGYAVLLLAWPGLMRAWPAAAPLLSDPAAWAAQLSRAFGGGRDALGGATPLALWRDGLAAGLARDELPALSLRGLLTHGQAAAALAFAFGGLWLLWRRIIGWRLPLGVLAGMTLAALPLWLFDGGRQLSPVLHLLAGAGLLGAFFIATDPVTSARGARAAWRQGLAIGTLVIVLRVAGPWPDAVAIAVLLLNLCTPLLDGHGGRWRWAGGGVALLLLALLLCPWRAAPGATDLATAAAQLLADVAHDNEPLREAEPLPALARDSRALRYLARRDGRPVASLYDVEAEGWGGRMRLLLAVDMDGRLRGLRVLAHAETPGLVGGLQDAAFLAQFVGHDRQPPATAWRPRTQDGEFDGLAGATVTREALKLAIRTVLDYAAAHPPAETLPPAGGDALP